MRLLTSNRLTDWKTESCLFKGTLASAWLSCVLTDGSPLLTLQFLQTNQFICLSAQSGGSPNPAERPDCLENGNTMLYLHTLQLAVPHSFAAPTTCLLGDAGICTPLKVPFFCLLISNSYKLHTQPNSELMNFKVC